MLCLLSVRLKAVYSQVKTPNIGFRADETTIRLIGLGLLFDGGPSGTEVAAAAPVAAEQALTGGSSQRKNSRKKKKDAEARGEPNEEGNVEQTGAGGSSK
ncbi:hypothetical protein DY000_02030776 [Brassica cretica]|uniref:Uncharacterized protein n=1 Tax=Brassica cretica TaxID=69181 RepID=A0ABQ7DPJ5_BRACR|nr:hypothetical protein DY000_02030776 [Brassica cretica]